VVLDLSDSLCREGAIYDTMRESEVIDIVSWMTDRITLSPLLPRNTRKLDPEVYMPERFQLREAGRKATKICGAPPVHLQMACARMHTYVRCARAIVYLVDNSEAKRAGIWAAMQSTYGWRCRYDWPNVRAAEQCVESLIHGDSSLTDDANDQQLKLTMASIALKDKEMATYVGAMCNALLEAYQRVNGKDSEPKVHDSTKINTAVTEILRKGNVEDAFNFAQRMLSFAEL
jgi:hypothetical protein